MSKVTTDQIKELREKTGVSVMQCKKALEEAGGDEKKAIAILSKKSKEIAEKKSDRKLGAGTVAAYVHAGNTVGAMLELLCETDFVAKNEEFQKLAYEIAMQIAAMNPEYAAEDDVPEDAKQTARELFLKEVEDKKDDLKDQIIAGKMESYFKDRILLKQPYIKDGDKTIEDLVKEGVQKFGENIEIGRFERFAI